MKLALITILCTVLIVPLCTMNARSIQVLPRIYPLCKDGPYPNLFIDSGNQLGLPSNQYVICTMRYYPLVFNCGDGLEFNWTTLTCGFPQDSRFSQSQGPVFYPFPIHTKPYIPPDEVQYHPTQKPAPPAPELQHPRVPPRPSPPVHDEPIAYPFPVDDFIDEPMHRPFPEAAEFPAAARPPRPVQL